MTVHFNNNAKSNILIDIDEDDTQIIIDPGDYARFLGASTGYVYAVLVNANQKEIVKIDLANSEVHQRKDISGTTSYSGGLSVTRGQGGYSAKEWKRGTLIYQEITESVLNEVLQEGVFRSVAYNPNGVLSCGYFGEKVYDSANGVWWKCGAVGATGWSLIAGVMTIATPTFSPAAGAYDNGQACTLACTTAGATIRYTIDGSTPDEDSSLYSSPFTLPPDATTTVKAKAFHTDAWWTESAVGSAEYVVAAVAVCAWNDDFSSDLSKWTISGSTMDVSGGKLRFWHADPWDASVLLGASLASGDFDVQVKVDFSAMTPVDNPSVNLGIEVVISGVTWRLYFQPNKTTPNSMAACWASNSSFDYSFYDYTATYVVYLRLIRVASTLQAYWSADGASWTELVFDTPTVGTGTGTIKLYGDAYSGAWYGWSGYIYFDDFTFNEGCPS